MIDITNPKDCCGCSACYNACNHNAIMMSPDELGFLYPIVDFSKCVDCGLCESVCSFNDNYCKCENLTNAEFYAMRHKNPQELDASQSGAAFVALSDYILDIGGVIYGAGYDNQFQVIHKRATTKNERNEFRGSKYVQSNLKDTFRGIKNDLKEGLIVLFSGTPCQISGLVSYVGNKLRENLFLVDIICHGVPSPYIWKDYIAYIEESTHDIVSEVNFRNKKFGWNSHRETFRLKSDNRLIDKDIYAYLFNEHVMFRESCGTCHFCNIHRPSDITMGDLWGLFLLLELIIKGFLY
jgi:coenzyme F420-reducing hydrogenase beta subunit